jgi:hypothetical protein
MVLSPLHFRRCALNISISEEEKQLRYLHIRSVRQRQYRRLTEASEALTTFFPQIISKVMSTNSGASTLNYADAAALVQSTY